MRCHGVPERYVLACQTTNSRLCPRRVAELEGVIESLRESNARLEAEVADLTRSSATGTPPGF